MFIKKLYVKDEHLCYSYENKDGKEGEGQFPLLGDKNLIAFVKRHARHGHLSPFVPENISGIDVSPKLLSDAIRVSAELNGKEIPVIIKERLQELHDKEKQRMAELHTAPEILTELAKEKNVDIRRNVASNLYAPPEAFDVLEKDTDKIVQEYIEKNPVSPQRCKKADTALSVLKKALLNTREQCMKVDGIIRTECNSWNTEDVSRYCATEISLCTYEGEQNSELFVVAKGWVVNDYYTGEKEFETEISAEEALFFLENADEETLRRIKDNALEWDKVNIMKNGTFEVPECKSVGETVRVHETATFDAPKWNPEPRFTLSELQSIGTTVVDANQIPEIRDGKCVYTLEQTAFPRQHPAEYAKVQAYLKDDKLSKVPMKELIEKARAEVKAEKVRGMVMHGPENSQGKGKGIK